MNTEIKEKWTGALRSGEYRQVRCRFKDDLGFCCLGVLADIIDPTAWTEDWTWNGGSINLPKSYLEEVGLTTTDSATLMKLNDDDGKNFIEIADYIEENL